MGDRSEVMMLVTVRVRYDPDFPDDRFVTLRRYTIGPVSTPEAALELTDVNMALAEIGRWLRERPEL